MKPETKLKMKAFFWDQLVRPFTALLNSHQLKLIFLAGIFSSIIIFESRFFFILFGVLELIIIIFDLTRYYASGEFMYNYRKYKYGDWKKIVREKKKDLNSLNNLNYEIKHEI